MNKESDIEIVKLLNASHKHAKDHGITPKDIDQAIKEVRVRKQTCIYCEHLRTVLAIMAFVLQVVICIHILGVF